MKLKITFPQITLALNLFGLAVSIFLWYSEATANVMGCLTGGCVAVLTSPYSKILGIPIAVWGVAFYGTGALLAFIRLFDEHIVPKILSWMHGAGSVLGSIYFFYLEIAFIHAICFWCKFSTATTIALLVVVLLELRQNGGFRSILKELQTTLIR